MKMTYRQMIMIFIVVAMIFFTINLFFPHRGPYVLTGVMITIFVIFKVNQYINKKKKKKLSLGKDENL